MLSISAANFFTYRFICSFVFHASSSSIWVCSLCCLTLIRSLSIRVMLTKNDGSMSDMAGLQCLFLAQQSSSDRPFTIRDTLTPFRARRPNGNSISLRDFVRTGITHLQCTADTVYSTVHGTFNKLHNRSFNHSENSVTFYKSQEQCQVSTTYSHQLDKCRILNLASVDKMVRIKQ